MYALKSFIFVVITNNKKKQFLKGQVESDFGYVDLWPTYHRCNDCEKQYFLFEQILTISKNMS